MSQAIRKPTAKKKAAKKSTRRTATIPTTKRKRQKKSTTEDVLGQLSNTEDILLGQFSNVDALIRSLSRKIMGLQTSVSKIEVEDQEAVAKGGFGEGMKSISELVCSIKAIEEVIGKIDSKQPTDRLENTLGRAILLSLIWYKDSDMDTLKVHQIIVGKVIDVLREWSLRKDVKTFEGNMDQMLATSIYDAFGGYNILG